MTHAEFSELANDDIDYVSGGNGYGVVAGPNGEGCTEPPTTEKLGTVLEFSVLV